MKRITSLFIVVLLLLSVGCENEKMELSWQSHAGAYLSHIQNLKCKSGKIATFNEESDWRKDDIVGTWQLLLDFSTGDTIDYSCKSVIYSFKEDSTVTLSSDVPEIPSGQFEYDYYGDPYCPLCKPSASVRANLTIGEEESFCQVVRSWMVTFSVEWGMYQVSDDTWTPGRVRGDTKRIYYKID
jgi:hypothetical protein